jgi:mannosyltransferase
VIAYVRRGLLLPLGLTWLALALRLHRLAYQSLWRDEVDTLRFASRALPDLLATFRRPGENGPLYFLGMRTWLAVTGSSEFALRFPSVLAGTLAVPVTYVVVHRLTGRTTALVAALLMTTAPYLVWYGQEARMYAVLTVLVPLSLWLTVVVMERGGWWRWILLYVVTSLSFYTHVLAALVVPVQFLWMLILLAKSPRRPGAGSVKASRWPAVAAYLVALVLPYLPMLWWQAKLWLSPTFQTGHPFVPLPDMLKVLAVAFSVGVLPLTTPVMLLPAILALLAGIGLWTATPRNPGPWPARTCGAGRRQDTLPQTAGNAGALGRWDTGGCEVPMPFRGRPILLLVIWLVLPALAVYGVSLGMPIFADRYLIWTMPAFEALLALGVVALARVWRPLAWVTLSACLLVSLAGVRAQSNQPIKSDFRAATQFFDAHSKPGDLLIYQIPYIRYTFTYYLGRSKMTPQHAGQAPAHPLEFPWLDGPYTNSGMSESTLAEQMGSSTAQAQAVWLIASEVPMWDSRGLTQAWLAAHGSITDHTDFARVSVTRYELRSPDAVPGRSPDAVPGRSPDAVPGQR